MSNIQVATLTISAPEAVTGQEVRVANSAYSITANFDSALTVTIPIYCWGEYTITSGILASRKINITNDQSNYEVTLYYRIMLYDNGDECTDITGGWTVPAGNGAKAADHIQLNNIGNGNTYAYSSQKVNTRGYSKLCMLFDCVASTHSIKYSGNICIATAPNLISKIKSEGLNIGVGSGLMIEMDITQYQADYYVLPYTYYCAMAVRQIWLE